MELEFLRLKLHKRKTRNKKMWVSSSFATEKKKNPQVLANSQRNNKNRKTKQEIKTETTNTQRDQKINKKKKKKINK